MTTDSGRLSGSREPSPAVSALAGFDPERIVKAFNKRLAIYREKRDAANPFGEDIYNRQDATRYVVEAIELLAQEAGLGGSVFIEPDDDDDPSCFSLRRVFNGTMTRGWQVLRDDCPISGLFDAHDDALLALNEFRAADAIAMEARQGTDPEGLDGEAATARAEGIAQ